MHLLAEIPFPRIDPILLDFGTIKVRWYGVTYILAFGAAFLVLRGLARRKKWPVAPERVGDVLFWGILGVFLGGRLGYILFYQIPGGGFEWGRIYRVWEGGMSFHGGLLGTVIAYWIYAARTKTPRGALFDGLTVATPLGIFFVRMANFINAELYGRVWDGPWAMKFPDYDHSYGPALPDGGRPRGPEFWASDGEKMLPDLRHPSQLYEGFFEGIVLFLIVRWLLLKRGWSNGCVAGAFLIGYGVMRFFLEYTRQPDAGLEDMYFGGLTQGQALCFAMVAIGSTVIWMGKRAARAATVEKAATPE